MKMRRTIVALALVTAAGSAAFGIIIRHDRDDARHRELGENHPAVVRVGGGMGTLLAPQWIITAGHVAKNLSPFARYIRVGDADYVVTGRAFHPEWKGRAGETSIDIALLRLDRPVTGITPLAPYPYDDELGKTVMFVGYGDTGTGETGPTHGDGVMRGATNVVAELRGGWVRFVFDAPPGGTDLEGISGPGDSGGPALIERDGKHYIAGVSSSNDTAAAAGPCRYGSHEYYPRVSTAHQWIDATIKTGEAVESLPWTEPVAVTGDNWPDTNAGRIAAAMFEALAGDDAAIARFESAHRSAGASARRSLEERVKGWRQIIDEHGPLRPAKYVAGEGNEFSVLVAGRDAKTLDFGFMIEKDPPHKLEGVGIGIPGPPLGGTPARRTGQSNADTPRQPPTELPDSPTGRAAKALVDFTYTAGDAALGQFIVDHLSPTSRERNSDEKLRGAFSRIRDDFASAEAVSLRKTAEFSAECVLRSETTGHTGTLALEVEPTPPHRIDRLRIELGGGPGDRTDPDAAALLADNMTDEQMAAALGAYVARLVERDEFSGAVLLARGEKPLLRQAYGLASKRYDVANRPDTKFNLGSMNKMLTGVAIVQLAEQGKLAFDDPIIKHVPDYPNKAIAEKVTIHHLLTHTSGMGSYWNERYENAWKRIRTVQDFVPTFVDDPLAFEPGERFGYSNAGYVVLGLIIERVSGLTYDDYIRQYVTGPAGMTDTDTYAIDTPVPNLAIGYTNMTLDGAPAPGPRHNNLLLHSIKGGPAGGGYSTVDDLLRFSLALQQNKLLSPKSTELLWTAKVKEGPTFGYAYGFGEEFENGHRCVGHNGGAPGISADFRCFPDLGYTYAVLSNYDQAAARVGDFIRQMIARREAP